jgi:hypothetical protein
MAADSDQLPKADAEQLRELVDGLDLDVLAGRSPIRGRGADRFQYDVVVNEGARHEITAAEDAAPPELRAVIDWVMAKGRRS